MAINPEFLTIRAVGLAVLGVPTAPAEAIPVFTVDMVIMLDLRRLLGVLLERFRPVAVAVVLVVVADPTPLFIVLIGFIDLTKQYVYFQFSNSLFV